MSEWTDPAVNRSVIPPLVGFAAAAVPAAAVPAAAVPAAAAAFFFAFLLIPAKESSFDGLDDLRVLEAGSFGPLVHSLLHSLVHSSTHSFTSIRSD